MAKVSTSGFTTKATVTGNCDCGHPLRALVTFRVKSAGWIDEKTMQLDYIGKPTVQLVDEHDNPIDACPGCGVTVKDKIGEHVTQEGGEGE